MTIRRSGLVFFLAAFPFVIPLIPSTDTQPTFSILSLTLAFALAVGSFERSVFLRKSDLLLTGTVLVGGLVALASSLLVHGSAFTSVNRVVAFLMFLIAIAVGVLNPSIFTHRRLSAALKIYVVFTVIFFLTRGAIESVLIRTRSDEISQLLLSGRGASTLSPEPSFFAFQIFTLFLITRLTVWRKVGPRSRHVIQLLAIGLLVSSFAGYGMLYALMVIFLSGARYIIGAGIAGAAGLAFIGTSGLRFVELFIGLVEALRTGALSTRDLSILGRLSSFQDYLAVFSANPVFGDAFSYYGGGGLVSLLAALGLFGLGLVALVAVAVLALRATLRMKFALLAWLMFQFISGPVGLPLVGLMVGTILRTSRLGVLMLAAARLARGRTRSKASEAFA